MKTYMKTFETKYLKFTEHEEPNRKTPWYEICARDDTLLGIITFYPQWRRYVFKPEKDTLFDSDCLLDIINFIEQIQEEWKMQHTKHDYSLSEDTSMYDMCYCLANDCKTPCARKKYAEGICTVSDFTKVCSKYKGDKK